MCDDKTTTTKVYHNNIPLPVLKPSIPCPDSDRCDTSGFHVYPPRRSSPTIIRFCPTLGWMYLVQNITHRTAVSVVLYSPTVFTVSDRWNGTQDNLLVQTISTKIRLNTYNKIRLNTYKGMFLESGYRGDSGPTAATVSGTLHVL